MCVSNKLNWLARFMAKENKFIKQEKMVHGNVYCFCGCHIKGFNGLVSVLSRDKKYFILRNL